MTRNNKPDIEAFAVDTVTAARLLGLSRSSFYQGLKDGSVGIVGFYIKTKRLFSTDELRRYVAAGAPPRRHWIAAQIANDVRERAEVL